MGKSPLIVFCLAAIWTCPLAAQGHAPVRHVGIGITVPDVGLFLPINVSRRVRLEPFVDFFNTRADYPVTSDTVWDAITQVGVAGFIMIQSPERLTVYFGPRVGLLRGSTKVSGSAGQTSTKSSGWFLAGAMGGEYGLAPRFSIGAEAKIQFNHASSSSNGSASIAPSLFARSWFTSGAFVVRFYP
jgi:hypothetical protein